jgi:hypothetical protein
VNPIVDTIMIIIFVLFMVFIFRGYHESKLHQREEFEKKEQEKMEADSKTDKE